ncbi:MAG: hypothetical protein FWF20_04500 [Betaproteobacteria bacterium]|nr:hypothetical protein [Betaproteobacteria bacterium]MCL2886038.1 hypothetical protein [Betaproteobacteria bacterium]
MKFRLFLPLLLFALFGGAAPAAADDDRGFSEKRESKWCELAPDERRQMRRQMREHWHEKHAADGDEDQRWQRMDSDERKRLRDEMRKHHKKHDDKRDDKRRGDCRD